MSNAFNKVLTLIISQWSGNLLKKILEMTKSPHKTVADSGLELTTLVLVTKSDTIPTEILKRCQAFNLWNIYLKL